MTLGVVRQGYPVAKALDDINAKILPGYARHVSVCMEAHAPVQGIGTVGWHVADWMVAALERFRACRRWGHITVERPSGGQLWSF